MSSFGGTVKLTGESEYQKALSGITNNLKVLNSEMKVVTSQYDKNDTSVENLSKQNDVLNKKIDEQQKKVDVLADALEKSKEETGENSNTTKKWQTELNNAQAELNSLTKQVNNNEKAMNEAADATEENADSVEEFGEEADNSGEKALSLGDIIKANLISDAIKNGLQALANGIKSVGSAMGESLKAGAEYADNILTLSAQTGLSTDTLEKYNAVAELTDVSMDTLTNSMAKNIKSMSDARDGSQAYADAYKKLGVQITDANGNLRNSETVYWETVDALKGITDETERDALAMELFGKKAQDLNTIIDLGSEGVAEYTKMAEDMGAVVGGDGLTALGNLDDQMQIFSSTTSSTKNVIATAFAPAITEALGGVNGLIGAFNGLVSAVISGEGVDAAFNLVSEKLMELISSVESALPQLLDAAKNLIQMLISVIASSAPIIIEQGVMLIDSLLSGISGYLNQIIPVAISIIEMLVTSILQNLPIILEAAVQLIITLANGIASMLPTLIPLAVSCILTLVETLLDNIDQVIDAAILIIMALADGILSALPILIDKIPVLIDKFIMAISDNLPKIIEMGIMLTVKLTAGILKATPQLLLAIPQIIGSLVNGFVNFDNKMGDIGTNLVQGIWNGIKNATQWVLDKIKGFGKSILNGIKDIFGIHSPSKVFQDEVGKNLALGVGEGFADTMADVSADMQTAIPTEFDADINTNLKVASGQAQMSTFDLMVSAFKQALSEVKVYMDDREMGGFVTNTVERAVFG